MKKGNKPCFHDQLFLFFSTLTLSTFNGLAHAQLNPPILNKPQQAQAIGSKKLENLLLCKPTKKFTRASAEDTFSKLGLVEDGTNVWHPSNGKRATVFNADIVYASINDESDEARLSVSVIGRSLDDIAKQLNVKRQRVNGPDGPRMEYYKKTGKINHIEIDQVPSTFPPVVSIDCVYY